MTDLQFLKKLQFDEKLSNSFIGKYLSNPRLLILFLLAILVVGLSSYFNLPRRLNPEIQIPIIVVSTVLPGASPEDIESLVTEPLESNVTGITDVKQVSSTSRENVSVIQIEFQSGIDPEKSRTDVQSAIDQVELPEDAQAPRVQKIDFENQPVWSFALIGKGDVASLTQFAKNLQDELENIPTIKDAQVSGLEEQEISVFIRPESLTTYDINPLQLSQSVKTAVSSFPAGSVRTTNSNFALSIDPSATSIEDVRNLQLNVNGNILPLSSIAEVTERSKPNQFPSYFANKELNGVRAVTFNIYKTDTANIDKAVKDSERKIEEVLANYPGQFEIKTITNAGEEINKQFDKLIEDFILTTVLVFLVLFVFLGLRQAIVSLFAVPLTFLISFSVMNMLGISLNFLSMFSLLLSLGLLVDDTIVVISAMTQYFRSGKFTPLQTGLLVWRDFLVAIFTTTLTTVWAFLPLLISTGIIGEFIKSIPLVVSSTLLGSFVVAMLIILPLMIFLLKPNLPRRVVIFLRVLLVLILLAIFISIVPKGPTLIFALFALILFLFVTANVRLALVRKSRTYYHEQQKEYTVLKNAPTYVDHGLISFNGIGRRYRRILTRVLENKENRRKTVAMVVIFSLFSYLLVPFGFVKNEFFPSSDQKYLYASIELPAGTQQDIAKKQALAVLDVIRKDESVNYVIADIGQAVNTGFGAGGGDSSTILFSLVLPEKSERDLTSIQLAEKLREDFASYTPGRVTVTEVSGGPPAGSDLQIQLFGSDLRELDIYASRVEEYLESKEGVSDVSKSVKPGTSKLVFIPNARQLALNKLSQDQLGLWLRTFASGLPLDTVKFAENGDEERDITLRLSNTTQNVEDIYKLSIPTTTENIPLSTLGRLEMEPSPTLITRQDGERTISVSGSVADGYSVSTLNQELEQFARTDLKLKDGYTWKTGGVNEENQNSVNSILSAMLISFLLIVITMVVQFSSFRKAIIVMLVIPLSISGVFILFALTGTPLSFPALIGVLALFGIVVKNSILIVDKITANQKTGMEFVPSIVDAAESRLEPIALTSLATIIGLIPITVSDPLWRGLGGAIIAGLFFSGTIMLFFIPIVYYYWFHPQVTSKRISSRKTQRKTSR